jgi:hypothetical protein
LNPQRPTFEILLSLQGVNESWLSFVYSGFHNLRIHRIGL